jgi:cyclic pyranopterin phosphate synthase
VRGHDLRALIRSGASDKDLAVRLAEIWHVRGDRYSELRSEATGGDSPRVEMSYIGG